MMRATFGILATLSLAATSLTAQSKPLMTVNVPFNFAAGAKTLPAGEYRVRAMARNVVAIQTADYKTTVMLVSHSTENTNMDGLGGLTFNRYGDRYFLSQIWMGSNRGEELPKSRAEKEQIAAAPANQGSVTLTAGR
jgi:hypothetical protein